MPLRLNHFVGMLIGRYLYLSNSQSKHVVRKNIQLCFAHLNKAEQEELIKKALIENTKGVTESGYIWMRSFEDNAKKVLTINGIQHLESERPVILLVPHFGCWEITGRIVALHKSITFMYKKLRYEKQNELLLSLRQQQKLYMASADKKGVLKLQRALKNKQLIAILPDQYPGAEGGIAASFFGNNAITTTLLPKLARKNNAKVVLAWAQRLEQGKGYVLNFKPVDILSESGELQADVEKMNKIIEALAKSKPEQYLWNYKRFKGVIDY
ncbi:Lipid A biosynthesis lauroyl acyltransferase [uncultured Candidatus Thioglobus sp.]|nr:Lipid A biosynthesis lauroyl acyltransferase [uncultured Candidatus Thioglobus sp.]